MVAWCSTTCRRAPSRAPLVRWSSSATTATARRACCRSATACSPMRMAARWRCRCTRETRPTAAPSCPRCTSCARPSALSAWSWLAIGVWSRRRPSTRCARPTASAGSRRSRAHRSVRCSSRGIFRWTCSMSAICSSSARRTTQASAWWPAAMRRWPGLRPHNREELLTATERNLEKIKTRVDAGKLNGQDAIGVRGGKIINQYKVAKHFDLNIADAALSWARKQDSLASEAALDGLYIVRTSVPDTQMDAPECVRNYKSLANVERAFRSLKTIDLKVRPIHHRKADRVRAHIFLCMLAYYVEWHLREAWRELMFADTEQQAKATRDPVAPAQRSASAQAKAATHCLSDATPAHSFATLMAELANLVRNTCRTPNAGPDAPTFELTTTLEPTHERALALVQAIHP